jgi:predicted transcriptional regulator
MVTGDNMKKNTKTIQLGLRIDAELIKKIERLAEYEDVDKAFWIKRALTTFVAGEDTAAKEEAVEDYISLRSDADALKKATGFNHIPKDIEDARKEVIKNIVTTRLSEAKNG